MGNAILKNLNAYNCRFCRQPYLQSGHEKNCAAWRKTEDFVPLHKNYVMGNSSERTNLEWAEVGRYLKDLVTKIGKKSVVAFLDGSSTLATKQTDLGRTFWDLPQ